MRLQGGAEINGSGEFKVFVNRPDGSRAPLISEVLLAWLRAHYEFLMSREVERVVCGVPLRKEMTRKKGLPQLRFRDGNDTLYTMIRADRGGFAIFEMLLPFEVPLEEDDLGGYIPAEDTERSA